MIDKEIINQSIEYIIRHCEEELSVDEIAAHFHFSKFYFSRCFRAATGESVYGFILRMKMDQSAIDIKLEQNRSITDIGLDYGYSASNYSSAFRKHHKLSPAAFRKSAKVTRMTNPYYPEGASAFGTFADYDRKIEMREIEDLRVLYKRRIGNYVDLKEDWPRFLVAHKERIRENTLFIERFYDDPAISDRNRCVYDLCMTTDDIGDAETEEKENTTTIPGGMFAVYRFEGKIRDIFCALQGVFSVWFPASGYERDTRYALNIYRKIVPDSDSVILDLCIPVKTHKK